MWFQGLYNVCTCTYIVITHCHCVLLPPYEELLADMKGYGPNKRYATELEKNRNEEEDRSKILEENAEDDIAPSKESFEFEVRKYKSKRKQELKVEQGYCSLFVLKAVFSSIWLQMGVVLTKRNKRKKELNSL